MLPEAEEPALPEAEESSLPEAEESALPETSPAPLALTARWQDLPPVLLADQEQVVMLTNVPEGVDNLHLVAAQGAGIACPSVVERCLDINGEPVIVVEGEVIDGAARFTVRAPAELIGQTLNLQAASQGSEAWVSSPIRLRVVAPGGDDDGDHLDNRTELELGTNPLAKDSDGDLIDDGVEVFFNADPTTCTDPTDTDGDGLSDCDENVFGTNVEVADTDGDGFTDFEEVVTFGFDPIGDNFLFNPLVADMPQIEIELGSVSIGLTFESSSGSEVVNEVEHSTSQSNTTTVGFEHSTSHGIEYAVSQGGSVTAGTEIGFPSGFSASKEAELNYETTVTTSRETTVGWSVDQSVENSETYTEAQAQASSEGTTISGGAIRITADIKNTGNLSFTLTNLALSALMSTPGSEQILSPLGTLSFDTNQTTFPEFSYPPNASFGPFVYLNDQQLDPGTVQDLLEDSSNLHVRVAAYEITDMNGVSFAFDEQVIKARTAKVIVNYGTAGFLDSESRRIATKVAPIDPSVPQTVVAHEALNDMLAMDLAFDAQGRLTQVRDVQNQPGSNSFWTVVHKSTTDNGLVDVIDLYTPNDNYDFRELELKADDTLHLVYFEDPDFDGLSIQQELAYGTDPFVADTDGDGLLDGDEIYNTKTDPFVYSPPPQEVVHGHRCCFLVISGEALPLGGHVPGHPNIVIAEPGEQIDYTFEASWQSGDMGGGLSYAFGMRDVVLDLAASVGSGPGIFADSNTVNGQLIAPAQAGEYYFTMSVADFGNEFTIDTLSTDPLDALFMVVVRD